MLKGKIVFLASNLGSKSEGAFPYIQLEDGNNVKIVLENDNPFENDGLNEYEDKTVLAEGEFNENGTFIATGITEIIEEEISEFDTTEEDAKEIVENKDNTEENKEISVENESNTEE